jgi:hypothetical protein
MNRLTNKSSTNIYFRRHSTSPRAKHHDMLLGLLWHPGWSFSIVQHIRMVTPTVQIARTRSSREPRSWPYPEFLIGRVLHQPPQDISNMPNLLPTGSVASLEESILFDSSGDPVPPIFLQLLLIFFNQHIQHGFYPLSRLSLNILLPHANL